MRSFWSRFATGHPAVNHPSSAWTDTPKNSAAAFLLTR